ncbi:phage tail sheath subtilisin-like domain-containing protein [Actinopolymorpha sp. B11F2]|uniref:phage tail sheath family protein n=1 Tax=Actinopolymorpha sp. B11F2 TaxID=3160862 RepID=UPI0032E49846
MPAALTYPGVYVQEIPSGSRAITGVATSIVAFVGRAARGPVDEPVSIASFAEFERVFGGLWRESGLGYAVRDYYLNGGSSALVVRLAGGATSAELDVDRLALTASGPGSWGNVLEVDVTHPSPGDAAEVAAAQGVDANDLFHLTLREGPAESPRLREDFLNLTVVEGPRRVDLVLRASQLVSTAGALPADRPAAGSYEVATTAQGDDGAALQADDYDDGTTFASGKKGLFALAKTDLFTLLCLPPSSPAGDLPDALWATALSFCRDRRAFLLVDPPGTATHTTVEAWLAARGLSGEMARNGALYFPRIRRPDPLRDGAVGEFVPCGAVAGVMARTDASRGVWKAPAGIDAGLAGVSGLTVNLADSENGALNPKGINCLRTFRGVGSVVWGARTLRGADILSDEYKYVPVRRLALFLEESLYRGSQWVVFEPNDEPLWSQVRTTLGAFMQDLFRQGAFQGRTPREAYFVRCDGETTTQYDIDRGIVNILVGFAPLKPAEFVVIGIQQKTTSASA